MDYQISHRIEGGQCHIHEQLPTLGLVVLRTSGGIQTFVFDKRTALALSDEFQKVAKELKEVQ